LEAAFVAEDVAPVVAPVVAVVAVVATAADLAVSASGADGTATGGALVVVPAEVAGGVEVLRGVMSAEVDAGARGPPAGR
jgi:hypothetical protein